MPKLSCNSLNLKVLNDFFKILKFKLQDSALSYKSQVEDDRQLSHCQNKDFFKVLKNMYDQIFQFDEYREKIQ